MWIGESVVSQGPDVLSVHGPPQHAASVKQASTMGLSVPHCLVFTPYLVPFHIMPEVVYSSIQ